MRALRTLFLCACASHMTRDCLAAANGLPSLTSGSSTLLVRRGKTNEPFLLPLDLPQKRQRSYETLDLLHGSHVVEHSAQTPFRSYSPFGSPVSATSNGQAKEFGSSAPASTKEQARSLRSSAPASSQGQTVESAGRQKFGEKLLPSPLMRLPTEKGPPSPRSQTPQTWASYLKHSAEDNDEWGLPLSRLPSPLPRRPSNEVTALKRFLESRTSTEGKPMPNTGHDVRGLYETSFASTGKTYRQTKYKSPFRGMRPVDSSRENHYVWALTGQRHWNCPECVPEDLIDDLELNGNQIDFPPYRLLINEDTSTMIIAYFMKTEERGPLKKAASADEVLAAAYRATRKYLRRRRPNGPRFKPLQTVILQDLTNYKDTWYVFDHVYRATRPNLVHGTQATWRLGERGFADLMDVAQAKPVLHMLREFPRTFGVRYIAGVTLVHEDDYREGKWHMRFELRGNPHTRLAPSRDERRAGVAHY